MEEYKIALERMTEFIASLKRRGRKNGTLRRYSVAIRSFIAYLSSEGFHSDPAKVDEDGIRSFVNGYTASENTIRSYITSISAWLTWCGNRVMDGIGLLWNENGCPNAKWISEFEFKRMVNAAQDPTQRLILLLAGRCGLRRSEIASLTDDSIEGTRMQIIGKGHGIGKIRYVPLTETMRREIASYQEWREKEASGRPRKDNGALVVSFWRGAVIPMSERTVYRWILEAADSVGVVCTPHSLRRLFATSLIDKGIELHTVSRLMGHANINTTMRYVEKNEGKMMAAMESIATL